MLAYPRALSCLRVSNSDRAGPAGGDGEWEAERPDITLADVGGIVEVKSRLNTAFLAPLRNPKLNRLRNIILIAMEKIRAARQAAREACRIAPELPEALHTLAGAQLKARQGKAAPHRRAAPRTGAGRRGGPRTARHSGLSRPAVEARRGALSSSADAEPGVLGQHEQPGARAAAPRSAQGSNRAIRQCGAWVAGLHGWGLALHLLVAWATVAGTTYRWRTDKDEQRET
jgi:hypothetical protein